jgi:outer membrane protein assembly factor BamC
MTQQLPSLRLTPLLAALCGAVALSGCSTLSDTLSPARVDYRSEGAKTVQSLEVPPDLTQLARDPRYQPPATGTVSATALQQQGAATPAAAAGTAAVALSSAGDVRIERAGTQRWLVTSAKPEQLWPQLRAFWEENGFKLAIDQPDVGVMETEWAENRAKLPQDIIRRSIGRVLDRLYDSGERDRFRTRVERGANGSEIYISHRGVEEVIADTRNESTRWQSRPSDTQLEAEMLGRLMLKLGGPADAARTAQTSAAAPGTGSTATAVAAVNSASAGPARARVLEGRPAATLQVDDGFDRAWRRVGLALDRGGFTVEDRDRNQGLYYVRYVDPKLAGKEEPGFLERIFSKKEDAGSNRYRIAVKAEGSASVVSVLDAQGAPQAGDVAQRIIALLVGELK